MTLKCPVPLYTGHGCGDCPRGVASSSDTLPSSSISSLRSEPPGTTVPRSVRRLGYSHVLLRRWRCVMPHALSSYRYAEAGGRPAPSSPGEPQVADQAVPHLGRLWCIRPLSPPQASCVASWMLPGPWRVPWCDLSTSLGPPHAKVIFSCSRKAVRVGPLHRPCSAPHFLLRGCRGFAVTRGTLCSSAPITCLASSPVLLSLPGSAVPATPASLWGFARAALFCRGPWTSD